MAIAVPLFAVGVPVELYVRETTESALIKTFEI